MKVQLPTCADDVIPSLAVQSFSSLKRYPAKAHARRVAALLRARSGFDGLIYLEAQKSQLIEDSDMPVPFRQRRYFYYLTGFNEPDAYVTYDTRRDELVLYIRPLNPKEVLWSGMPPSIPECLARYNVDEVKYSDELEADLEQYIRTSPLPRIFCIHRQFPPVNIPRAQSNLIDNTFLQPCINSCRVYKDSFEIALIRKAVQISLGAHEQVRVLAPHAENETQLQASFEGYCIAHMAKQQAYEPICAGGRNAATLHYVRNDQPLKDKQLALIDCGCEWQCYASDITRTFPVSGVWTTEAKAVYAIVEEMQRAAIWQTLPGIPWGKTHYIAHQVAVRGLLKLGILRGADEEFLLQTGITKAFFPHGLGHFIGLDVHDVDEPLWEQSQSHGEITGSDDLPYISFTATLDGTEHDTLIKHSLPEPWGRYHVSYPRVLAPGMVLTVEPGIYFCEWIIRDYLEHPVLGRYIDKKVLDRYWDVGGVRIEDVILVTADGNENLGSGEKVPIGKR